MQSSSHSQALKLIESVKKEICSCSNALRPRPALFLQIHGMHGAAGLRQHTTSTFPCRSRGLQRWAALQHACRHCAWRSSCATAAAAAGHGRSSGVAAAPERWWGLSSPFDAEIAAVAVPALCGMLMDPAVSAISTGAWVGCMEIGIQLRQLCSHAEGICIATSRKGAGGAARLPLRHLAG